MIITLKGADFSANNIGTLSTWIVSRVLGTGATYSGVYSVDRGASFSATVTIAEGYELGSAGVTVTMGGDTQSSAYSISGSTITISISSVTGNIVIKVPTKNTSTGSEDSSSSGGDGEITKVDMTSITVESNDTEHNLASGTAGVSTGIVDTTNPYFNSNVYLPAGIYLTLPDGAYQVERYYESPAGIESKNIKMSFFNSDKLVVTAEDHSGIPDATAANSTTSEGYISTIISVPTDAKYFSYQLGNSAATVAIHKIIVYCK